ERGHDVRATVRTLSREGEVREMVARAGAPDDRLELVVADLDTDDGWRGAVDGCRKVLHVASPFPLVMPRDHHDLIRPARDGALRVLRAARDSGVERVVLTSSFAAVGYSPKPSGAPYDETDWTNPDQPGLSAYVRSKTIAERAAWDFIEEERRDLELSVVNPVGVIGTVLGPDLSTSIELVRQLLDGKVPGTPRLSFGLVDVRDVADLHLRAMDAPEAAGERFLAISGQPVWMSEVAAVLRERAPELARRVPTRGVPDAIVRLASLVNRPLRQVVGELGHIKRVSNDKARTLLGWEPRPIADSVVDTATSLASLGLLRA
ncbi:MAG TPA: aldehyde reductase, partial [Acidimicrobiales bacterium]|nr:aldehyde reductase [Acidimicrobiales bacterium]